MIKCDMCHKPLKAKRYQITGTIFCPDAPMTVGPECFRKEKKARKEAMARYTTEEIAAMTAKIASRRMERENAMS